MLRCFSRVTLEQTAQSLFAAKLTQADDLRVGRGWLCFCGFGLPEDRVVDTLVRVLLMTMYAVLAAQVIEMPLAEHDEMVQAFLLDRLNESLQEGIF